MEKCILIVSCLKKHFKNFFPKTVQLQLSYFFSPLVSKDFPPALNALGFYEVNMRQNYSGAAAYFRRAADKGDRDGLTNLAVCYDNGWVEGHPPDKVWTIKKNVLLVFKTHPVSCAGWFYYCEVLSKRTKFPKRSMRLSFEIWTGKVSGNSGNC